MGFNTDVSMGEVLTRVAHRPSKARHRDAMTELRHYMETRTPSVCVIYGLRRTGKTWLMLQAASESEAREPGSTAYVNIEADKDTVDLREDMDELLRTHVKYVFVDEVTYLEDFWAFSQLLADKYAQSGMRVILSGTNSLAFALARGGGLYDRAVTIHTTRIPYAEHARLLSEVDVDEYMRMGGLLSNSEKTREGNPFYDLAGTNEYIHTAIAKNAVESLRNHEGGASLGPLGTLSADDALVGAIQKVVQESAAGVALQVIRRTFKPKAVGTTRGNLQSRHDGTLATALRKKRGARAGVDYALLSARMLAMLGGREATERERSKATTLELSAITRVLQTMDVLTELHDGTLDVDLEGTYPRLVVTQPGMQHAFVQASAAALLDDPYFRGLSASERAQVLNDLEETALGVIMENVVLAETTDAMPAMQVFKLSGVFGDSQFDIDMCIRDPETSMVDLYEIKHSDKRVPKQSQHLTNEGLSSAIERKYGAIASRTVLYRGETLDDPLGNGVAYKNVEEYLVETHVRTLAGQGGGPAPAWQRDYDLREVSGTARAAAGGDWMTGQPPSTGAR